MTSKHLTLATITGVLTVIGSVCGGATFVAGKIDTARQAAVDAAVQHAHQDAALDARLTRLETAVRVLSAGQNARDRELLNQVMATRSVAQRFEGSMQRRMSQTDTPIVAEESVIKSQAKKTKN